MSRKMEKHPGSQVEFLTWGFPKIKGPFLGAPIIRTAIYLGSILGSPYFGKLPRLGLQAACSTGFGGRPGTLRLLSSGS